MLSLMSLGLFASSARAAEAEQKTLPPVSQRFQSEKSEEIPHFQRHVLPLLSRLGCNGRACHGSFQGQGGFRLSLFGYDFKADLAALTEGDDPRVDLKKPEESLILQKPLMLIDHEGGQRFKPHQWEHHLLQKWIAAGAPGRGEEEPDLLRLEIEPAELVFSKAKQHAQLTVTAIWSDDSREDITPLCRFRSNDESIAEVDEAGMITALSPGDTHVVAFYDNGITPIPVILPVSDQAGSKYPQVATPSKIDELVVQKLRKLGSVPSEICTDAEFLRRVSLDITGTPATPAEIQSFIRDRRKDKRTRKIDELLKSPAHAAWMTTRLSDWTGNSEQNLPVGGEQKTNQDKSNLWYDWIYRRIDENMPYDQLVEGIMLAVSRQPEQTEMEYYQQVSSYFREKNPADFSQQKFLPYFWTSGRFSPPQTLRVSYAFLGVRLECAECHKHPYDQWTQADFEDFQAFFKEVRFGQSGTRGLVKEMKEKLGLTADQDSGGYKKLFADLAHDGTTVPWGEVRVPDWQKKRRPKPDAKNPGGRVFTPRLLGGEAVIYENYSDPREPVMDWLRQPQNPYFARTIVNRIWVGYFGIGIIDPPDDMNLANPATNEPLLNYLATAFVEHDYDLKWLHKEITSSDTYQRSWRPNSTNLLDEKNFSRAQVRRLPAEVMYDSLQFVTASESLQKDLSSNKSAIYQRQIGPAGNVRRSDAAYAMKLFGKPEREQVCDCERSSEPSLLQTIYVRNDAEVQKMLDRSEGWLSELKSHDAAWFTSNQEALVTEAWLRVFGRSPRTEELALGRESLEAAPAPIDGLRDLLWALLNSKEFILNH